MFQGNPDTFSFAIHHQTDKFQPRILARNQFVAAGRAAGGLHENAKPRALLQDAGFDTSEWLPPSTRNKDELLD